MTRSGIPGATDYSGQSLQEIIVDLKDWKNNIEEVQKTFAETIKDLQESGYWSSVDYDFEVSCYSLQRDFKNSLAEIDEVLCGIDNEIQDYHVNLLKSRGQKAEKDYAHHKKTWKASSRAYDNSINFNKLETLYREGSDMNLDMVDLLNLSIRLQDFVGRKRNNSSSNTSYVNNFHAPVQGYMQNINSQGGEQVNTNSLANNEKIEELRESINDLKKSILSEMKEEHEFEEIQENILDLEKEVNENNPKKSRIKSFGKSLIEDMQRFNTINAFSANLNPYIVQIENIIRSL